ncbi:MAG: hypothetical protein RLN89_12140 [Parvibaculum sp.]
MIAKSSKPSGTTKRLLTSVAFILFGGLSLAGCETSSQGTASTNGENGVGAESLAERVDRLERELANLRIDYSVVRPSMERIVSDENGLEARLSAIESAFGPVTASISPQASQTPAYQAPAATPSFAKVGIHLASYRDQENVERGWAELQTSNKDLLSDLGLEVVDYRSGSDGIYKRLIAGPLDPAVAESRCASLKDRGIWCQVVTITQ